MDRRDQNKQTMDKDGAFKIVTQYLQLLKTTGLMVEEAYVMAPMPGVILMKTAILTWLWYSPTLKTG